MTRRLTLVACLLRQIEGRHDGRRVIANLVVLRAENQTDLRFVPAVALVDTGATSSGIGPRIVKELNLRSYGKQPLISATEIRQVAYYIFRLGIPPHDANGPDFPYVIDECLGFSWDMHRDFDVILGMDILAKCRFTVEPGRWSLTFGL